MVLAHTIDSRAPDARLHRRTGHRVVPTRRGSGSGHVPFDLPCGGGRPFRRRSLRPPRFRPGGRYLCDDAVGGVDGRHAEGFSRCGDRCQRRRGDLWRIDGFALAVSHAQYREHLLRNLARPQRWRGHRREPANTLGFVEQSDPPRAVKEIKRSHPKRWAPGASVCSLRSGARKGTRSRRSSACAGL